MILLSCGWIRFCKTIKSGFFAFLNRRESRMDLHKKGKILLIEKFGVKLELNLHRCMR